MKRIIKYIMSMIMMFLIAFTLSSCDDYVDYVIPMTRIASGGWNSCYNKYHNINLSITTGDYNFVGDFRIMLDDEVVFNSSDYNYLVPKKTKIFSRKLKKLGDYEGVSSQSVGIEILDNSAKVICVEKRAIDIAERVKDVEPFTYEEAKVTEDHIEFNESANEIGKGNNILLFKREGNIGRAYVESNLSDVFVSKIENVFTDVNNTKFGYMIITSKEKRELNNNDLVFKSFGQVIRIYLDSKSERTNDEEFDLTFDLISTKEWVVFVLVNIGKNKCRYDFSYSYDYRYRKHLENGKVVDDTEWVENDPSCAYKDTLEIEPYKNENSKVVKSIENKVYVKTNTILIYREIRLHVSIKVNY